MSLTTLEVMRASPVMPVIVIDDKAKAIPLVKALASGGITVFEVTLRTPAALDAIAAMTRFAKEENVDILVGAGTVRNGLDAKKAKEAGAVFAVSPGYTREVGLACQDLALPLLPGVATGGEIMTAMADGYQQLKFFPAEQAGGVAMLKAFSGPFFDVQFCPTGGITATNALDYLALSNVVCVGGSWLTPAAAVKNEDWGCITNLAKNASEWKKV